MKDICILLFLSLFFSSCKKEYTCICYKAHHVYSDEVYRGTVKARNKEKADYKCANDFKNSLSYVAPNYCEIK